MHLVIALLYSFVIYFACVAYAVIVDGPAAWVALAGPFIISGAIAALLTLDWAVRAAAGKVLELLRIPTRSGPFATGGDGKMVGPAGRISRSQVAGIVDGCRRCNGRCQQPYQHQKKAPGLVGRRGEWSGRLTHGDNLRWWPALISGSRWRLCFHSSRPTRRHRRGSTLVRCHYAAHQPAHSPSDSSLAHFGRASIT